MDVDVVGDILVPVACRYLFLGSFQGLTVEGHHIRRNSLGKQLSDTEAEARLVSLSKY